MSDIIGYIILGIAIFVVCWHIVRTKYLTGVKERNFEIVMHIDWLWQVGLEETVAFIIEDYNDKYDRPI